VLDQSGDEVLVPWSEIVIVLANLKVRLPIQIFRQLQLSVTIEYAPSNIKHDEDLTCLVDLSFDDFELDFLVESRGSCHFFEVPELLNAPAEDLSLLLRSLRVIVHDKLNEYICAFFHSACTI
jgi:hypothetical protein